MVGHGQRGHLTTIETCPFGLVKNHFGLGLGSGKVNFPKVEVLEVIWISGE